MTALKAMKQLGALCERLRNYRPEKEARMKVFARIVIPAALVTLAILINPVATFAQNVKGCAWPIELSPEGFGNATSPDTAARYWLMPFDKYETMTMNPLGERKGEHR